MGHYKKKSGSWYRKGMGPQPLTVEAVEVFRDWTIPGTLMHCLKEVIYNHKVHEVRDTCIVLKKYPHFAWTSKGCQQWSELAILNRDLVLRALAEQ